MPMMNPSVLQYLMMKKKQEEALMNPAPTPAPVQPAPEENSFGLGGAVATGLSGLGDAFNGAAGRSSNNASTTAKMILDSGQNAEKLKMEKIKAYLEAQTGAKDMQYKDAQIKKIESEKPKPGGSYTFNPKTGEYFLAGKKISSDQIPAEAHIERMADTSLQEAAAAQRAADAAQKKEAEAKGRTVPGFESDGSVLIDDTEAKKLRDGLAEYESFKQGIKEYRNLIDKYGTTELLNRGGAAKLDAIAKNLQLKVKNLAQLGVLSASDIPYIEKQIPEPGIFTTREGSLGALDSTESTMTRSFENQMKARGYRRAGGGATMPAEAKPQTGSGMTPEQRRARIAELKAKQRE